MSQKLAIGQTVYGGADNCVGRHLAIYQGRGLPFIAIFNSMSARKNGDNALEGGAIYQDKVAVRSPEISPN